MSIADAARQMYEREWKQRLESEHRDEFVAIVPESKSYFLGDTFLAAALSAKHAHPQRKSFVLKIGHDAAFHLGSSTR
jgi:hypothetical protein